MPNFDYKELEKIEAEHVDGPVDKAVEGACCLAMVGDCLYWVVVGAIALFGLIKAFLD